jgi:hypothetical protein
MNMSKPNSVVTLCMPEDLFQQTNLTIISWHHLTLLQGERMDSQSNEELQSFFGRD